MKWSLRGNARDNPGEYGQSAPREAFGLRGDCSRFFDQSERLAASETRRQADALQTLRDEG
jgi:hypothetical protein